MSRPSALAVVRLMMRSNLVGCSTGMLGRLRAAQNLVDIVGGAPKQVRERSVHRTSDLPLRPLPGGTCIVGTRAASANVLMRKPVGNSQAGRTAT